MKFNNHGRSVLWKVKHISAISCTLMCNKRFPQNTKLLLYKTAVRWVLTCGFSIRFSINQRVGNNWAKKIWENVWPNIIKIPLNDFPMNTPTGTSGVRPFCKFVLSLQKKFVEKLARMITFWWMISPNRKKAYHGPDPRTYHQWVSCAKTFTAKLSFVFVVINSCVVIWFWVLFSFELSFGRSLSQAANVKGYEQASKLSDTHLCSVLR